MTRPALGSRRTRGLLVAGLLVCAVGCGSPQPHVGLTETATPVGRVSVLHVTVGSGIYYDQTTLLAKPGRIRVVLTVNSGTPHDFGVEGVAGSSTDLLSDGKSAVREFTITTPGDYAFICSIHPEMRGTLRVG